MLSTNDASILLQAEGIHLSSEQVAELARNQVFPNAQKLDGRWLLPVEDLASFIRMRKQKSKRAKLITAGTIGLLVTLLGLLSVARDTLDLVKDYVLPKPTPSFPVCTIIPFWDGSCIYVKEAPSGRFSQTLACLSRGAQIEVIERVSGFPTEYYRIASYRQDRGPVVVTEVLPNSPAQAAGMREGDVITRIDDLALQDTAIEVWRDYARRMAGQPVKIVVERGDHQLTLRAVPRDDYESGEGPIGYRFSGGVIKGSGGYVAAVGVSCAGSEEPNELGGTH